MKEKNDDRQHVFLLRHGKPAFPDKRSYIYGHTDYPLARVGQVQARRLGMALSGIRMDRIVSSDLARAAETADIVAGFQMAADEPPAIARDPELREINMGEWDGLAKEEIAEAFTDIFRRRGEDIVNTAAPGGETFVELQRRGIGALERILAESRGCRNVLLVAHGGIFWTMVAGLFDIPLDGMFCFGLDYCALHLIEHDPTGKQPWGRYRLLRYNWSPDLMAYMDDFI